MRCGSFTRAFPLPLALISFTSGIFIASGVFFFFFLVIRGNYHCNVYKIRSHPQFPARSINITCIFKDPKLASSIFRAGFPAIKIPKVPVCPVYYKFLRRLSNHLVVFILVDSKGCGHLRPEGLHCYGDVLPCERKKRRRQKGMNVNVLFVWYNRNTIGSRGRTSAAGIAISLGPHPSGTER